MSTISASTTSTTAFKITTDTTGALVFQTGSSPTTAVTFDGSQNVGLGVTPSAWGSYSGAMDLKGGAALGGYNNSTALFNNSYYNGTNYIYKASTSAAFYQMAGNVHQWYIASSGTAGGTITFTQAMTLNASGNLGVGTTSPNKVGFDSNARVLTTYGAQRGFLELGSDAAINNDILGGLCFVSSTTNKGYIYCQLDGSANGSLSFGTNNTERMRLDSSGNLGLGVTPSAWGGSVFKVFQLGGGGGNLSAVSAGGDEQIQLVSNAYYDGSAYKYVVSAHSSRYIQNNSTHIWDIAGSGTAGGTITYTSAMTLDASGRLGVGTTSPSSPLHVSYDSEGLLRLNRATTTTGAAFIVMTNGGGNYYIGPDSSAGNRGFASGGAAYGLVMTTESANPVLFGTNNIERARIDTSGNVLVNMTSAPINSSRGLYVGGLISPTSNYAPSSNIGGQIAFAGAQGSPVCGRVYMGDNTGWQWEWGPYGGSGWVRRFYFTDAGSAYSTTGTWGTISDATLKENIVDATPKLAELMQLRVRNFNFISEPGVKQLGFVAQEVEQVFPRLVDTTRPDENGNSTKAVKTTVLIPMLVKAIQELNERLEALEAK